MKNKYSIPALLGERSPGDGYQTQQLSPSGGPSITGRNSACSAYVELSGRQLTLNPEKHLGNTPEALDTEALRTQRKPLEV